jgi:hypothetical protein
VGKLVRPHLEDDPLYYDKLEKLESGKKNARQLPRRYFCRAMESGVCFYEKYKNSEGKIVPEEMILLTNEALKNMAPTAEGIPVYVRHVEEVDLSNLQEEADGYVVKSFFNELDAHWWMEFMAVSDDAHDKIQKGWKVSTAYTPINSGPSGTLHNVKYNREIKIGEYTHLAIVDNPRYENAIIMTPEQFKEYNDKKEKELAELKNSKGGNELMSKFKVFLNKLVGDTHDEIADPSNVVIETEGGKKILLSEIINAVEKEGKEKEKDDKENCYDNDTEVTVGKDKMKLGTLMEKYNKMKQKKNAEDEEEKKKKEKEEEEKNKGKKNADAEAKEKAEKDKQNALDKAKADEEAKKNFDQLNNAHRTSETQIIETSQDKVERGKAKYGA